MRREAAAKDDTAASHANRRFGLLPSSHPIRGQRARGAAV